ncbi:MAG: hypothetical protein EB059_02055 [Alphaproteobacteria bacterium]|nr:hypothetical protein [Alphaproteobacteria bacterium]
MRIIIQKFLCVLLLALAACADTEWPQWISGEPTREQLDAYKGPIAMPNPKAEGKAWPNLADVPARPAVILPDDQKNALVTEMKNKNTEGVAEIAAYNAGHTPVVKPAPKTPLKKKKKVKPDAQ